MALSGVLRAQKSYDFLMYLIVTGDPLAAVHQSPTFIRAARDSHPVYGCVLAEPPPGGGFLRAGTLPVELLRDWSYPPDTQCL